MKLSTKGRYGLRAMVDLAVHSGGGHVALYSIAERENISENYLEQVFSTLRKAGLVKSVKGAQGGYTLADKPSNITVGAILRVLEGNLSVVDEDSEASGIGENSIQHCIKVAVWDRMTESLNKLVDSMTLEDLANEYRRMNGKANLMYYI
ncbi:MAG: Rrf2 family transcriptional regulator [Clostridiales bacterium]|nr:Rrf2 family transcriptional regulator [Eubacteriales bacterium]MDH7566729.1 Rrf2 family transcriptional regulator [Clostridiales bacterium]